MSVATVTSVTSPHVLREYAFLGDGERGALIGPRGDVAWMCAPRWHDDAVFASLLGVPSAYSVTPVGRSVWGGWYEDGSLIWRSRWVTETGFVECREALAFPGDVDTAVLLRRVVARSGPARVGILLAPRAEFGRYGLSRLSCVDGVWRGRTGGLHVRWSGAEEASLAADGALGLELSLEQGEHRDLVLEISTKSLAVRRPPDPVSTWEATEYAWTRSTPSMDVTVAADDARQSRAFLRGMTSSTGAMVAASTTSLPERAAQGRNYDYRYAWIRDQCYAGQAMSACDDVDLLDCAVAFVTKRVLADGERLAPAYTIDGRPVPSERTLDLPGYPGATSTVGNWVNEQFQLDNFGEVLLLLAAAAGKDRLDVEQWRAAEVAVAAIESRWQQADSGIWELQPRHWTHSRLMCAAGLRALGRQAPSRQGAAWSSLADAIVSNTAADCVHESGRWMRSPHDERVDASLLLPGLRGAVPARDPRTVATVEAVQRELGVKGYVYRFPQDARPLGEAEGAFLLCGFHMSMASHQQGDHTQAMRWFERNRAACGSPGLFTEEYDVEQRQLRGNYPQAFVHALLIEAAARLAGPTHVPMT